MSKHERTAIEVSVLTKSMYYLATYDQLNCPCLAGVEVMAQRLAQLIDAYASGDASRPNFKGATLHLRGVIDMRRAGRSSDLCSPQGEGGA
jgi:hypothetical protein